MNYEFPLITNINDLLPAVEGRDEFVVAVKDGGYTVINYNVSMVDTFPVTNPAGGSAKDRAAASHIAKLRRECRGIIFDTETGNIIRRPFHKFFNVNEREETLDRRIDMSRGHTILDKLDGSMIAPFIVDGKMIWGTKMGATTVAEPVEDYVANNPEYISFADDAIENGWTPIFEWCSRKQRIVLDYFDDQLILTAMRNLRTGQYASYGNLVAIGQAYAIPVVRAFDPRTDMKEFIAYVAELTDTEGFVVRFDDGHMVKLKCDWYVDIHKAKEKILQDRNIVEIVLNEKLDDLKAHLLDDERDRLTVFENDFNAAINDVVTNILTEAVDIDQRQVDRKTFAIEIAPTYHPLVRAILFGLWDVDVIGRDEVRAKINATIRSHLGKTVKYEVVRDLWFPNVRFNV